MRNFSILLVVEEGKVTLMQGLGVMQGPVHDCNNMYLKTLRFISSNMSISPEVARGIHDLLFIDTNHLGVLD